MRLKTGLRSRNASSSRLAITLTQSTKCERPSANGNREKAVETIKEAIRLQKGDTSYYQKQLDKFMSSEYENPHDH